MDFMNARVLNNEYVLDCLMRDLGLDSLAFEFEGFGMVQVPYKAEWRDSDCPWLFGGKVDTTRYLNNVAACWTKNGQSYGCVFHARHISEEVVEQNRYMDLRTVKISYEKLLERLYAEIKRSERERNND
jgi:hypothetical protein